MLLILSGQVIMIAFACFEINIMNTIIMRQWDSNEIKKLEKHMLCQGDWHYEIL